MRRFAIKPERLACFTAEGKPSSLVWPGPGWYGERVRAARVMVNGVPKSGTHLVRKLAALLGYVEDPLCVATEIASQTRVQFTPWRSPILGRGVMIGATTPRPIHRSLLQERLREVPDGSVFHAHCGFSSRLARLLASERIAVVCVLRDPRDIAVSLANFLRSAGHRGFLALGDEESQLRFALVGGTIATADGAGTQTFQPLAQTCEEFWRWRDRPEVLVTKFEDLVGAAGGGDDARQAVEIARVARHVAPGAELAGIRERLFGGTATFHRGRIGSWRECFRPTHRELCRESGIDDYLVRAGYEADGGW